MNSECKFEVGKRYRDGHGEIFTIDQLDGAGSYEGVSMPVEGHGENGSLHSFTVDGQYLHYQSCNDLIPEPIADEPDKEIVELEAVDEIALGALVKPEQLELAREMCRNGEEFWVSAIANSNLSGFALKAMPEIDYYWSVDDFHVRRGPVTASGQAIAGEPEVGKATPADEAIHSGVDLAAEGSQDYSVSSESVLPDSGDRTEFDTGAVRDTSSGKGVPSLVPPAAIRSVSRRFEDGATKYGRDNWLKGIPLSRYQDAIIRHTLAAAEGQTDEDHLGAVLWNAAAWIETERRINAGQLPQSLDDLPYRERHETPHQAV